jgi:hypothetical protein
VIDASGPGGGILQEIMKRERIVPIVPITVTSHGGSRNKFTVLKTDLVETFLDLISGGRVRIADGISARDLFFEELRSYRSRQSPQGRTTTYYSSGGGRDDILDAAMLACYAGAQNWAPLFKPTVGIYGRVSRRWISGNRCGVERNSDFPLDEESY